ncbi:hypothetical protein ACHAXT_005413 [Thalassiosira profunda]
MVHNESDASHPHYRYNHYPQRSSCSYASANLSSYSSSGYPALPSVAHMHAPGSFADDLSALSLYQAFAAVSGSGAGNDAAINVSRDSDGAPDKQWAVTSRLDETVSSNYIGDINESSDSTPEDDGGSRDGAQSDEISSIEEGETAFASDGTDPPDENDEESSWATFLSMPTNTHLQSYYRRHRKKIGSLLISVVSLWVYNQIRRSRRQRRQLRYGRYSNQRESQLLGWLLQLLSPARIAKYFQQLITTGALARKKLPQSPPWSTAATTPLSHLLSLAKDGNVSKLMNPGVLNEIISSLLKSGCDDITTLPPSLWQRFLRGPAVMTLPFAYLGALYWMMRRLQRQQFDEEGEGDAWKGGSGHNGKSRHATTFDDVAGIDSSLQELSEIISYMRDPSTFHSVGAQPPRGILLSGSPGSGKTLLARAIAGEASRSADGISHIGGNTIDCFAVSSGSEFVETYVGRGAARVRSLFKNVREEALRNFKLRQRRRLKRWNSVSNDGTRMTGSERGIVRRAASHIGNSASDLWEGMHSLVVRGQSASNEDVHQRPMAIIFIDEIDALAKRRDSGFGLPQSLGGGGCDEREQTLNQLLTEMDGFVSGGSTSGVNVIVIAATNRPEVLDPAIMRPGRFDRHVRVSLPDARGREAILRVHARHIRWDGSSVNFKLPTEGFSGADLKNVINEAALLAVRSGSPVVTQCHLLEATQKVRAMSGVLSRHPEFR